MLRAGIFGRPGAAPMESVAEGLRDAGFEPVFQRPSVWHEQDAEGFAVVVTTGQKLKSAEIADLYRSQGVPVLSVDLPPIRKPGLWALWHDKVNVLPDEGDRDRLRLVDLRTEPRGSFILVCGQKGGDAAHEMARHELEDYFGRTISMLKTKHPAARIVWRPHPQERISFSIETSDSEKERLSDALAGCGALVTFNSTCGIEALERGIPVFCDPSSYYRDLAGDGLPELSEKDRIPTIEEREGFFSRLASVCWQEWELATKEPWLETLERVI